MVGANLPCAGRERESRAGMGRTAPPLVASGILCVACLHRACDCRPDSTLLTVSF
jgi:hypothetical protein